LAVYWFLLLLPMFGVLSPQRLDRQALRTAWLLVGVIFVTAAGFRYQVGCDWGTYLNQLALMQKHEVFISLSGRAEGVVQGRQSAGF